MDKRLSRYKNVNQMLLVKVEAPEEKSPGVVLEVPEPSYIKEELEEVSIALEEKELRVKEETNTASFPVSTTSIKSEDDAETHLFSRLHKHQKDDNDCTTSRSNHQMIGTIGEKDFRRAESIWNTNLNNSVEICNYSESEIREDDEEYINVNHPNCELKRSDINETKWESRASMSKENTISKSFICSDCGKQFVTNNSLKRHMAQHPRTGCSSCLGSKKCFRVKKTVDTQNIVQTTRTYFTCHERGKTIKRKRNVKHKIIHKGEKPFCCDLCGNSFNEKSHLDNHMRIHTREKPFSCDLCGRSYSQKSNLDKHKRIHTGDKPFWCDFCGHRFSDKSNLNSHKRIHTGEKPFCCDLCGYSCSRKSNLDQHKRIHTGEKPFCCDFCGLRFSEKSTLNSHKRIHTGEKPFRCGFCGHSCSRKSSLNLHMRIHTGEKPFYCDLCGHTFSQKSNLNMHKRIHSGKKRFCCGVYGQL